MQDLYDALHADPRFHELEARRARLAWSLTGLVLVAYFGFVLAVAFAPQWLAAPVSEASEVSRGIPIGVGLIVLSIALTGLYVHYANLRFDPVTAGLLAAAREARAGGAGLGEDPPPSARSSEPCRAGGQDRP